MRSPQGARESAQDTTYRWLKRHIGSLPRHEGTFLTEAEVCEATGTSRTPVREALLRLETEGFLKIMPKKGAFVPPVSDAEIEAVMQARELVEDWCVRRAAPLAEGLAPELDELVREQGGLLEDPVAFIECDRAFHRAIVRTAGNAVLAEFYETLRDRQVRMGLRAIAAEEDRARVVLAEHTAIVDALRSGDPLRSARALAAHLGGTLAVLRLPAVANWDDR
ncbi:GntR family transcriptional regulator [Actinomadura rubrisoli]|uniref:GntR family transcriptional regulator n=1 Tax=Actinomadura rubrisoli TaxID=2530368 RepID=A0A4V2YWQ7_9ACTN|nr:GntR family transcriptional regulator [Actinomadura rubrisoli]TDD85917.1 GntR family transcriptional regulator [Actinomadura rubrisoli]